MNQTKEDSNKEHIYFNMNVPGWFKNIEDTCEKCRIVEDLARELKDESPITEKQWEEMVTIK